MVGIVGVRPVTDRVVESLRLISGPEGGLSPLEEQRAIEAGALPVSLGRRTLRADTAPLAALAALALRSG